MRISYFAVSRDYPFWTWTESNYDTHTHNYSNPCPISYFNIAAASASMFETYRPGKSTLNYILSTFVWLQHRRSNLDMKPTTSALLCCTMEYIDHAYFLYLVLQGYRDVSWRPTPWLREHWSLDVASFGDTMHPNQWVPPPEILLQRLYYDDPFQCPYSRKLPLVVYSYWQSNSQIQLLMGFECVLV